MKERAIQRDENQKVEVIPIQDIQKPLIMYQRTSRGELQECVVS